MEQLVTNDEKLPDCNVNFKDNSALYRKDTYITLQSDDNEDISSEDDEQVKLSKKKQHIYADLALSSLSRYEDTPSYVQYDFRTKPYLTEDIQSSRIATENDAGSFTESSFQQVKVHKSRAEIHLNLGSRNDMFGNSSSATWNAQTNDGDHKPNFPEDRINAVCNSFRVLNSIREEDGSEASQDDAYVKLECDYETDKHRDLKQQQTHPSADRHCQSGAKMEHSVESLPPTKKKVVKVRFEDSTTLQHFYYEPTKEVENCCQELSIPQDSAYIQIHEDPCGGQALSSRTHSMEDVISKLPKSPCCRNKFQYPPIFSKKHAFGWRRPSDITDLQSQGMWMEDHVVENIPCTPPRRRHSDDIPQRPLRYLNVRFNNFREILNSHTWLSTSNAKKKERSDTIVELDHENDMDAVKPESIWIHRRDENAEVILESLREVVRKCTDPNPSLRPSSAEVYRKLNKNIRKLKQGWR